VALVLPKEITKIRDEIAALADKAQLGHPINAPSDCIKIGFNAALKKEVLKHHPSVKELLNCVKYHLDFCEGNNPDECESCATLEYWEGGQ